MKLTKYPQSNFLIENEGEKILIDPGNFTFEKYSPDDFGTPDAILITHQHSDHMDTEAIKHFIEKGVPMYGNHDVVSQFEGESFEITKVEHEREFDAGRFKIKPIDLPHAKLLHCPLCDKPLGKDVTPNKKCTFHPDKEPHQVDGPPNTGFVINGLFFHPGDGIKLGGLKVVVLKDGESLNLS